MKKWFFLSLLLFLVSCSSEPTESFVSSENLDEIVIPQVDDVMQATLPKPFSGKVSLVGDKPIFYRGEGDAWDSSLVFPGAAIYHDGLYHLFYNGMFLNHGMDGGGIGYAVSTNATDWYRVADAPLLTWDETVGADLWISVSSVLIDEDGLWTLYLSSTRRAISEETPSIWRATASSPNGPWEFDEISLLEAGISETWDHYGVQRPAVLKIEDQYQMYYLNQRLDNRRGFTGIGMATSTDGLSWTKYNDATTDKEFKESDAIFTLREGSMGFQEIQSFNIWQDETGFAMLYFSGSTRTNNWNYATSPDGITWTDFEENPILTADDIPFLSFTTSPEILYLDGKYFFYFRGGTDRNRPEGDIYLATSE